MNKIWKYHFIIFTLYFKVLFMEEQEHSLQELQHIKKMMERSSRFISLSGLSGIAAGVCALFGAWFANDVIIKSGGPTGEIRARLFFEDVTLSDFMGSKLLRIAVLTFIAAFISAFIFTYIKSKRNNIPLWGATAKRLLINVAVPMLAGGFYLFREIQLGHFGLIAPGCLIFYGLALVNASKYTLNELRYLGYGQLILAIINLKFVGYGFYFWAIGFGVLHIVYGAVMWLKYEKE